MASIVNKDFFCERCKLQFDKKIVYDIHLKIIHKEDTIKSELVDTKNDISIETSVDNIEDFSLLKMPINAISKVHEGKKEHKCTLCYANFSNPFLLKNHREEFHNFSQILHKCLDCDYSSLDKYSLKDHLARVHERRNDISLPNTQKRLSISVRVELGSKNSYTDATQVSLNTQYLTNPTIVSLVKMEYG